MKIIEGGVCAAKGFKANGIHCGLRKNRDKKDLALVISDVPAAAAAVHTTNLVKGAPNVVTKRHLENGRAMAIICNSGNANTCNADGIEIAEKMAQLVAGKTGISADDVVVGSTGVIGQPLNLAPIAAGIDDLVAGLSYTGNDAASEAIMTTDTKMKQIAVEFEIGGKTCRIGGMAKGSGMIHPNMATMLVYITTDAAVSSEMLGRALKTDVADTFNMTSVDGDTSTNDMVAILANGLAGNEEVTEEGPGFTEFMKALNTITVYLCKMIAGDGEGATKLLECNVSGGYNTEEAKKIAKSVICSSLVKSAMFGSDANWGRILCAVGYAQAKVNINKVDLSFKSAAGEITVCINGAGVPFSEEEAKIILAESEIDINITLHDGDASATAWGCDLTYEYVKINGDYRT